MVFTIFSLLDTILDVHVSKIIHESGMILVSLFKSSLSLKMKQDTSDIKDCVPCCTLCVGQLLLKCSFFYHLKQRSDWSFRVLFSAPGTVMLLYPVYTKLTHGAPLFELIPPLFELSPLPPLLWLLLLDVSPFDS